MKYSILCVLLFFAFQSTFSQKNLSSEKGVFSINTPYTITKVRTALNKKDSYIVASSYEGVVLGISYSGKILWENKLSGYMNHDIWTGDINNDGIDEVFAANADGNVYCINSLGKQLWKFSQNEAPMYSVCVIKNGAISYVVCGGYDNSFYYVSADGKLISEIPSSTYSLEKSRSKSIDKKLAPDGLHLTNFIRSAKSANGKEILVVHGVQNSMNGNGHIYFFNPLEKLPYESIAVKKTGPFGDLRIVDTDNDGNSEVLLGKVGASAKGNVIVVIDSKGAKQSFLDLDLINDKALDRGMYQVTQPELITQNGNATYMILYGSNIILYPFNGEVANSEVVPTRFSFNDMYKDPNANKVILASAQSGGSAVHIIDFDNAAWKEDYKKLMPPGKIQSILTNTDVIKKNLQEYKKPSSQNESAMVYFMTESRNDADAAAAIENIESYSNNPVFMNGGNFDKEKWDRSAMASEVYKNKRDQRMKYVLSQDEVLEKVREMQKESNGKGISYWGGHGNDPYMYQVSTTMKALDAANGNKTVLVYPEVEDHSDEFKFVMNDMILPLAEYAKTRNGIIYLRNKHLFWQSSIYMDKWKPVLSGAFASVIVPAMEETTDKSMELSLASRMGLWAAGSVDSWGARCARDNASFDRLRQHSNQTLPNHFLKTMVYSIASGAQYINNFSVDQKYMSLLWDLIAKGALYVPKRSDILSFSPVHLSIANPGEEYLDEASNVKWLTFFDKHSEKKEPFVFSRLNGTWPGAPLTPWDFSRYAAGVVERRLNFIPKYSNGLVLITPPQKGVFADKEAVRKQMTENMHPWYKNILKEYYTNGRDYLSADGKATYAPDEYYKVIANDIEKSANLIPINVSGSVGWVVAQTGPKNLRLTIVENGYINPNEAIATVKFNQINVKLVRDILSGEEFKLSKDKTLKINIALGGFRFIDIELENNLLPTAN